MSDNMSMLISMKFSKEINKFLLCIPAYHHRVEQNHMAVKVNISIEAMGRETAALLRRIQW